MKRTIEDLTIEAAKRGGKCLSVKYGGIDENYDWACKNGHNWSARAYHVLKGSWCPACAGVAKITLESMQNINVSKAIHILRFLKF